MCVFKGQKVEKTLIFYTHTHTHTHVSTAKKFFARKRKSTTVDVNGGLTIFNVN